MSDLNSVFPKNKAETLALLYMEKQNAEGKTPEVFAHEYQVAYEKINAVINSEVSSAGADGEKRPE